MPQPPKNYRDFKSLVEVVQSLRGPDGCPWDKEQTHKTLTKYAIEETYEFVESVDKEDKKEMKEELGDMLFQVLLHSEIARQNNDFDINDVIEVVTEKMVRRHPHVFANVDVENSQEVVSNWNEIKQKEKNTASESEDYIPFNFPLELPALIASQKIGEKTNRYNFDWKNAKQVLEKVEEELTELKQAMESGDDKEIEHESGDLLFSSAQLLRHLKVDAEQCLRIGNERFLSRFRKMQDIAKEKNEDFKNLPQSRLEELWTQAKR